MTFWKIILDAGREKVGSVSVDRFELPLIHSALSVTGTGIRILPVLLVKSDRLLANRFSDTYKHINQHGMSQQLLKQYNERIFTELFVLSHCLSSAIEEGIRDPVLEGYMTACIPIISNMKTLGFLESADNVSIKIVERDCKSKEPANKSLIMR